MTPSVGTADRIVRVTVALAAIAAGVYFQSWWGALGLALLVTDLVRRCPACRPLKLTTIRDSLDRRRRWHGPGSRLSLLPVDW